MTQTIHEANAFLAFCERFQSRVDGGWLSKQFPKLSRLLHRYRQALPVPASWLLPVIMQFNRFRYSNAEAGEILKHYRREDIAAAFGADRYYGNLYLNLWEYEHGRTVLESYPCDITIPIADICNARCTFCTSWLEGQRLLKLAELDAFETVIRHACVAGLAGHGEPLSHPELPAILERLDRWLDHRAQAYVITNGVYLARHTDALVRARVRAFAISLNAASAQTHETVMGLEAGAFERVLDGIRGLIALRDSKQLGFNNISVTISLVLTQQNMAEVAAFVRLGNALNVNGIQLKTLAGAAGSVVGLNYHQLPPYLHPDYAMHKADALAAIRSSSVPVMADPDSWDTPVFPENIAQAFRDNPPPVIERQAALKDRTVRAHYAAQQKYNAQTRGELIERLDDSDGTNPHGRTPRFACRAPYYHLYLNDFSYNLSPCCYMGKTPGHESIIYDGSYDFFEAWNSPALVALRERLKSGPLFRMCTRCPAVY